MVPTDRLARRLGGEELVLLHDVSLAADVTRGSGIRDGSEMSIDGYHMYSYHV
jgi:hypothetical protein